MQTTFVFTLVLTIRFAGASTGDLASKFNEALVDRQAWQTSNHEAEQELLRENCGAGVRDKTGTNAPGQNEQRSQGSIIYGLTSMRSQEAEGMGFERPLETRKLLLYLPGTVQNPVQFPPIWPKSSRLGRRCRRRYVRPLRCWSAEDRVRLW
jgi:hypothetical protein